ncbi:hypothetical protein HRbin36_01892 [bacterium HR36]|nr:hypothetical protein HRbin36_01892 [bacterium HR36]
MSLRQALLQAIIFVVELNQKLASIHVAANIYIDPLHSPRDFRADQGLFGLDQIALNAQHPGPVAFFCPHQWRVVPNIGWFFHQARSARPAIPLPAHAY